MIRPSEWLERLNASDLPQEAKVLLTHMLTHAREHGGYGVLVTDEWLMNHTGMAPKQIIKHLYTAFKKGWLHARAYAYGSVPPSSTCYILSTPPIKQAAEKKPRVARKARVEMTLREWEATHGELRYEMFHQWVVQKQFCPTLVAKLVEEFRIEMASKAKLYADFKYTFQNYLNKGYLSLKPNQVLLVNSPHAPSVGAKGKEAKFGISA